jgi:phosphocarrier protein HPr
MERELRVLNRLGLHARPAAEFVRCARKFKASVTLRKDGERYSAASILDLLSANLDCGSTMIIEADGSDAATALDALGELLKTFKIQEEG